MRSLSSIYLSRFSRFSVTNDIARAIRFLNTRGLFGFSFVLQSGSLTVLLSQGVCGGEFFGFRQNAVLRNDEIVVGLHIVVAAETAYGFEIFGGWLTTDEFHYI